MIDGEILGDLDRRVGHVSDTHHCGLRLSIDEISKVIEVVSNGRIASIVDHHKKLKCGVVVTGRDELLHFQHVLALLHLNVFGPEHGNLVGIISPWSVTTRWTWTVPGEAFPCECITLTPNA